MAKIPLDIGHATGTGAHGCGHEEHSLIAALAPHVEIALAKRGHEVSLIDFPRESNGGDLAKTREAANEGGFPFGISLHCDWADNEFSRGAHACYRSQGGKRLAKAIMKHLYKVMPGRAERVKLRKDLYILNKTNPVWVLVEVGFITSPQDVSKIIGNPQAIAEAIAEGVEEYIKAVGLA